jgi:hypothetical protein
MDWFGLFFYQTPPHFMGKTMVFLGKTMVFMGKTMVSGEDLP